MLILSLFVAACQPASVTEDVSSQKKVSESPVEQVQPVQIYFTEIPARVKEKETIPLRWTLSRNEPFSASHTAIHYDSQSHVGSFGVETTPATSGYPSLTTPSSSITPASQQEFTGMIPIPPLTKKLFLRAHAIIDGRNYWTEEREIQVLPEAVEVSLSVREFTIEGDDNAFYPPEIIIQKGEMVKITFVARSKGVYYGGLDFRGKPWGDTGRIRPGESTTVSFTAAESFEFKSYWPATKALKATGKVIVE